MADPALAAARREAEEALAVFSRTPRCSVLIHEDHLRALLAEPAGESGSVSTVRSDDPPAKPLPTCCNCGSNFITPASVSDAVREAAELLRFEIDALPRPDLKYATLNTEAVRTLLAALDAREPDGTAAACRLHWGTGAGLRAEGKP